MSEQYYDERDPGGQSCFSDVAFELEHAIGCSCLQNDGALLHPNGTHYVYASGASIAVTDINETHDQTFLRGHSDNINCLSVSRSGFLLSSSGADADVCVWDFNLRKVKYRLEEHDTEVACVCFSDDDRLLMSVGGVEDRKVVMWDMSCGHIVSWNQLPPDTQIIDSHCGGKVRDAKRRETEVYQFAVIGTSSIFTLLLDPFAGTLDRNKLNTSNFSRKYSSVRFCPNGELLFVSSESGDVGVFSLNSGTFINHVQVCSNGVRRLAVEVKAPDASQERNRYAKFSSSNSVVLYAGGGDGTVATLLMENPQTDPRLQLQRKMITEGAVTALTLSGDASQLLVVTTSGNVSLLPAKGTAASGKERVLSQSCCSAVTGVRYHPYSNETYATVSADGFVRIWDANSYRVTASFRAEQQKGLSDIPVPTCVEFIGNTDVILSGWSDCCVKAHDSINGELIWALPEAHRSPITCLVASPNMKFFITASVDGEIRLWETKSRELVSELAEHTGRINKLKLFEEGQYLLSASRDRTVMVWDLKSEKRVSSFEQRMGGINTVELCADQNTFITGGTERRLTKWSFSQPGPVYSTAYSDVSGAFCTCMSLSHGVARDSSSQMLATGGTDQVVKLWDSRVLDTPIACGVGHSGLINDLQFSPDDRQVVSVGQDKCSFMWNIYSDVS